MNDMNQLCNTSDKWTFNVLADSGSMEPEYPAQLHFCYGEKEGDETYNDPDIILNAIPMFEGFYSEVKELMKEKYSLESNKQLYHNNNSKKYYYRFLDIKTECNKFKSSLECSLLGYESNRSCL